MTFAICGAYQQDRIYELEDFNLSRKEWIVSTLNYGRSYSAEWGDYDNDGDYDLAIIGRLNELSKIYENVKRNFEFSFRFGNLLVCLIQDMANLLIWMEMVGSILLYLAKADQQKFITIIMEQSSLQHHGIVPNLRSLTKRK